MRMDALSKVEWRDPRRPHHVLADSLHVNWNLNMRRDIKTEVDANSDCCKSDAPESMTL